MAVAWILGLSGAFHTHATASAASHATLHPQDVATVLASAAPCAEKDCALCVWKATTPYAPAAGIAPALEAPVPAVLALAPSRAPPAVAPGRYDGRAPPLLLSCSFDA